MRRFAVGGYSVASEALRSAGLEMRGAVAPTTSEQLLLAGAFVLAVSASLTLTLGLELQNSPDAALYTSGFSLFPSPLGTILGTLLGVEGLAVLQALTIGAVVVALIALRVPLRAIVVALPVLIWVAPLSLNVIAGALFAFGWWRRRARWQWVAAGFHLSTLLLVIAANRTRAVALLALALGVALLVVTPYSAGLETAIKFERAPEALLGGLCVATLGLLPGLVAGVRVWETQYLALGVALALATAYAVRFDLSNGYVLSTSIPQTCRYALPVVFVCFIEAASIRDQQVGTSAGVRGATR